jgi:hypothetical protein
VAVRSSWNITKPALSLVKTGNAERSYGFDQGTSSNSVRGADPPDEYLVLGNERSNGVAFTLDLFLGTDCGLVRVAAHPHS